MASSRRTVNLDWQIAKMTNGDRARHMLETSLYADCEFLVGGNDEVKELIKAHRIFLAMGSPVFEAMFYGGMAQAASSSNAGQDQPITVPDLQPSAFKDLLEYIYTERMDLRSFDQALELCYAAKKYMLPKLVARCSQYMWSDLGPENVCRALEFANLYEDETLKSNCLSVLRERTRQSLGHSDFEEITESTLLIIVKEDLLDISEVELFDAAKRWASRQCSQRDLEVTGTNMRQVLNTTIGQIRFLSMTPEEFASSPALSGILTQDEGFAILMNLSSRDKWPMPSQLSLSREPRRVGRRFDHGLDDACSSGRNTPARSMDGVGQSHGHSHGPSCSSPGPGSNGAYSLSSTSAGTSLSAAANQRVYCFRRVEGETLVHNAGILDCAVTLTVDRNVCIQGIVISSQGSNRPEDPAASDPSSGGYTELLYCHLLDRDGTRLTYSHFSGRSPRRSTLDVFFNRPVYVQRNREYRICVVLNRPGYYPLGTASTWVITQGVHFRFGSSSAESFPLGEGIRDGFIRGVIFNF